MRDLFGGCRRERERNSRLVMSPKSPASHSTPPKPPHPPLDAVAGPRVRQMSVAKRIIGERRGGSRPAGPISVAAALTGVTFPNGSTARPASPVRGGGGRGVFGERGSCVLEQWGGIDCGWRGGGGWCWGCMSEVATLQRSEMSGYKLGGGEVWQLGGPARGGG